MLRVKPETSQRLNRIGLKMLTIW